MPSKPTMKHITSDKGSIGELRVAADLILKGYNVFYPASSTSPFDLLVYKDGEYKRLQVKYRKIRNGVIPTTVERHSISLNKIKAVKNDFMDVLAMYCPDTDKCYYIPQTEMNKCVSLRVEPTKNGQIKGIRMAEDFLKF